MWPRSGAFFAIGVLELMLVSSACAPRTDDTTPAIAVSPGAKGRILVMDRLRHHGAPRRFLPHVTVEEIDDDAGLDETEDDAAASDATGANESDASDAGAP